MKRVAVLIHSIYVEYSLNILEGICNFYKDKNVQLFVSQVGIADQRLYVEKKRFHSGEIR